MVQLSWKLRLFRPEATPQGQFLRCILEDFMKKRITVENRKGDLYFYLRSEQGVQFLFVQKFTRGVYDFFRNGISERQLRACRRWDRNPRLDKTIEKLPLYITYVMRGCA